MISGTVKRWDDGEGWGVLVSPEVPGEVFAHFSCIDGQGYTSLYGEHVQFEWEPFSSGQDGTTSGPRVWFGRADPRGGSRQAISDGTHWGRHHAAPAFASSPSWIAPWRSMSFGYCYVIAAVSNDFVVRPRRVPSRRRLLTR